MALAELLRMAEAELDLDTLRQRVRVMTQALMELEVPRHLGAGSRVREVSVECDSRGALPQGCKLPDPDSFSTRKAHEDQWRVSSRGSVNSP